MRVKPLIAIPLIAIALTGCAAQQPAPEQSSVAEEQKPLFSSDEEALAAAQAAYANYLEVSDQIARDGGANPERLKGLVSDEIFEEQITGYNDVKMKRLNAQGNSYFDNFSIQSTSADSITNYVCLRLSEIKVFDDSGLDVTPVGRDNNLPLELEWKLAGGKLVLEKSEVWTGQNFCL
jgi:hypothetical protein